MSNGYGKVVSKENIQKVASTSGSDPIIISDRYAKDGEGKQYIIEPNTAESKFDELYTDMVAEKRAGTYDPASLVVSGGEGAQNIVHAYDKIADAQIAQENAAKKLSDSLGQDISTMNPKDISKAVDKKDDDIIESYSDKSKADYDNGKISTSYENLINLAKDNPEAMNAVNESNNDLAPFVDKINNGTFNPSDAQGLADILTKTRNQLSTLSKGNDNLDTATNDWLSSIASPAYLKTQAFDEGVQAGNQKASFTQRAKTSWEGYQSGKMSLSESLAYLGGIGSGSKYNTPNESGTLALRKITDETLFRSGATDEMKGAVLSSEVAQDIDNNNSIIDYIAPNASPSAKEYIRQGAGSLIRDSLGAVVGLSSGPIIGSLIALSCLEQDSEVAGKMSTTEYRNRENQNRLANMDKYGNVPSPSPANGAENAYNILTKGSGKDAANISSGVTKIVSGFYEAAAGSVGTGLAAIADGAKDLLGVASVSNAVNKFVDDNNGYGAEQIDEILNSSDNSNKDVVTEKKSKDTGDIQVQEQTGNENESDKGKFNQPAIDADTLSWLIRSNPSIYSNLVK